MMIVTKILFFKVCVVLMLRSLSKIFCVVSISLVTLTGCTIGNPVRPEHVDVVKTTGTADDDHFGVEERARKNSSGKQQEYKQKLSPQHKKNNPQRVSTPPPPKHDKKKPYGKHPHRGETNHKNPRATTQRPLESYKHPGERAHEKYIRDLYNNYNIDQPPHANDLAIDEKTWNHGKRFQQPEGYKSESVKLPDGRIVPCVFFADERGKDLTCDWENAEKP